MIRATKRPAAKKKIFAAGRYLLMRGAAMPDKDRSPAPDGRTGICGIFRSWKRHALPLRDIRRPSSSRRHSDMPFCGGSGVEIGDVCIGGKGVAVQRKQAAAFDARQCRCAVPCHDAGKLFVFDQRHKNASFVFAFADCGIKRSLTVLLRNAFSYVCIGVVYACGGMPCRALDSGGS